VTTRPHDGRPAANAGAEAGRNATDPAQPTTVEDWCAAYVLSTDL